MKLPTQKQSKDPTRVAYTHRRMLAFTTAALLSACSQNGDSATTAGSSKTGLAAGQPTSPAAGTSAGTQTAASGAAMVPAAAQLSPTQALVGSTVSCGPASPVIEPNIHNPLVQWSLNGGGGTLALVQSYSSRFGSNESTTLMGYSTLTLNEGAPAASAYVLSVFNYDPCVYESAHGTLTMPKGGQKMEIIVPASAGDGATPWLFAGDKTVGLGNAKLARFVSADATTGQLTVGLATSGNVNLTGATVGGSGKRFADGRGIVDTTFVTNDPNIVAQFRPAETNYNLVGAFFPQLCDAGPNAPTPKVPVDPASPIDSNAIRVGGLFNLGTKALSTTTPTWILPGTRGDGYKADVRSEAALLYQVSGSGVSNQNTTNLAYATLTKNPDKTLNDSFVLSLYNYDPCDWEAHHGDFTMPADGLKMEAYVTGRSGDGSPWLANGATALSGTTTAQARLVKVASQGCGLEEVAATGGTITLTGEGAGGSGKILATGTGKMNATFKATAPSASTSAIHLVVGRFTPAACSKLSENPQTITVDPAACTDAKRLRQTSLLPAQ